MKAYIGTSGFAYKEWKGKFYPEKIRPPDMLRFYAGRLQTVEINNTFYHMPRESVLTSWGEQVLPDFVFAFKAPQLITHLKQLRNVGDETGYVFRSLSGLGKKFGSILFQFPKSFRLNAPALKDFLALIPGSSACAFEFRSPTWLDAGVLDLLREHDCSLCIADSDESPAQEIVRTASWGYLRLRRSDYTDADLARWADTVLAQKWEKVFVFFKHEDGAKGPELAMRFQALIDSRLVGEKSKAG